METLITDDEMVPETCQCPHCGEARIDYLALDEDDWVTCQTCFMEFPI